MDRDRMDFGLGRIGTRKAWKEDAEFRMSNVENEIAVHLSGLRHADFLRHSSFVIGPVYPPSAGAKCPGARS